MIKLDEESKVSEYISRDHCIKSWDDKEKNYTMIINKEKSSEYTLNRHIFDLIENKIPHKIKITVCYFIKISLKLYRKNPTTEKSWFQDSLYQKITGWFLCFELKRIISKASTPSWLS